MRRPDSSTSDSARSSSARCALLRISSCSGGVTQAIGTQRVERHHHDVAPRVARACRERSEQQHRAPGLAGGLIVLEDALEAALDVDREVLGGGVAVFGCRRERQLDDVVHVLRELFAPGARHLVGADGRGARQQLIEDDATGVDITLGRGGGVGGGVGVVEVQPAHHRAVVVTLVAGGPHAYGLGPQAVQVDRLHLAVEHGDPVDGFGPAARRHHLRGVGRQHRRQRGAEPHPRQRRQNQSCQPSACLAHFLRLRLRCRTIAI